MSDIRRCSAVIGLILIAAACAGCGGSGGTLYPTSGTVTYEGKPLEGATVLFIPPAGAPSMGMTDASGKYALTTRGKPGAPAGAYDVTVTKDPGGTGAVGGEELPMADMTGGEPSEADLKKLQDQTTQMGTMMQEAVKNNNQDEQGLLPRKYSVPQSSGLNAAVTSDESKNVFDFTLTPEQ